MYLATHSHASNREIADAIGITDQAQASRILARMEDLGLIHNRSQYNDGAPNAWQLTADGRRLADALQQAPRRATDQPGADPASADNGSAA